MRLNILLLYDNVAEALIIVRGEYDNIAGAIRSTLSNYSTLVEFERDISNADGERLTWDRFVACVGMESPDHGAFASEASNHWNHNDCYRVWLGNTESLVRAFRENETEPEIWNMKRSEEQAPAQSRVLLKPEPKLILP